MGKVTVYGYECWLIITHVAICLVSVKSSNVTDSERSDFEFESKNSVGVVFVCLFGNPIPNVSNAHQYCGVYVHPPSNLHARTVLRVCTYMGQNEI